MPATTIITTVPLDTDSAPKPHDRRSWIPQFSFIRHKYMGEFEP